MRNLPLSQYPSAPGEPVHFPGHTVFTERITTWSAPVHKASHLMICSLGGTVHVKLHGHKLDITPEYFLLVNRGSSLALRVESSAQPMIVCFESGGDRRNPFADWNITERLYAASSILTERAASLAALRDSCSSFVSMKADAILRSLLAEIISHSKLAEQQAQNLPLKKRNTRHENYKRLASVRDWMVDHFQEHVTLDDLASAAALAPQHFLRLFAQLYGKTPRQYLIDLRIEEAKKLLRARRSTVKDVCHAIGWESPETFSLLFKQKTGLTPGDFRRTMELKPGS